jgi:hypothetical protein
LVQDIVGRVQPDRLVIVPAARRGRSSHTPAPCTASCRHFPARLAAGLLPAAAAPEGLVVEAEKGVAASPLGQAGGHVGVAGVDGFREGLEWARDQRRYRDPRFHADVRSAKISAVPWCADAVTQGSMQMCAPRQPHRKGPRRRPTAQRARYRG